MIDGPASSRFAVEEHFLLVDVRGPTMTVTPVCDVDDRGALTPIAVRSPEGSPVPVPFVVHR